MTGRFLISLLALLSGCSPGRNEEPTSGITPSVAHENLITFPTRELGRIPAGAYLDPVDQKVASTGSVVAGRIAPCMRERFEQGQAVQEMLPTDKCVKMEPRKLWKGKWIYAFEDSEFCPDSKESANCFDKAEIWLTNKPNNAKMGSLYSVEFFGRKTLYSGSYGHFGAFEHEVIVDEMISMKLDKSF